MIYMTGETPKALLEEEKRGLVKVPIAVTAASADQKLHPMSRLNFGKHYSVEHNIRAMNVGFVAEASRLYLKTYFENAWNSI